MTIMVKTGCRVNTAKLQGALNQWGVSWAPECDTPEFYLRISTAIRLLNQYAISEPYLLRDWVWITAQFRIAHSSDEDVARESWSAMGLFVTLIQQLESGNRDVLIDVCWLTDRTIEKLLGFLGARAINKFISSEEIERIDDLLIELADAENDDLNQLKSFAKKIATEFSEIHNAAYFPSMANKLLDLCNVAHESSEKGYWARAALRYLSLEDDVINDSQGYIGFLDDIHVIENMYGFVFGELPWKRLIDHAAEKWPFITRVYWQDKDSKNHLTLLLKAVVSCCLDSSLEKNQTRNIVLPEIGPCGFLSAAACALKEVGSEKKSTIPSPGTLAAFRDGHNLRYVMMADPYKAPDGSELPMVRLKGDDKKKVHIPSEKALLLEQTNSKEVTFATQKQLDRWLSKVEEDSQTAVHKFHAADAQTSVLYVTTRSDFFAYLETICPYGRRLDELITIEYRSRVNRSAVGSKTSVVDPTMIVCSSLDVAESILRDRVEGSPKPQYMIIDRAVDHVAMEALKERCRQYDPDMKVIVISRVDTRAGSYPDSKDDSVWFIKPEAVDPISTATNPISITDIGKGPLARYVKRQNRASDIRLITHFVEFAELDEFYQIAQKIKLRAFDEDSALLSFAMSAETVLKHISTYPPMGNDIYDEHLIHVLGSLAQHAAAMGMYDQDINNLASASDKLLKAVKEKNPKAKVLYEIIKDYKKCHIVVASRSVAETFSSRALSLAHSKIELIPVHDLQSLENVELLLVPGWLGRKEMLHLRLGGWSGVQIHMLYGFECQRSSKQARKLEKTFIYLDKKTQESWKSFSRDNPEAGNPPSVPRDIKVPEFSLNVDEHEDEPSESDDWLESAVREHMTSSSVGQGMQTQVLGRLMFFNDSEHYALFADNAKLVCLNEILGGALNTTELSESDAEKLLWKSTKCLEPGDVLAFPDDPALGDVVDELADAIVDDDGVTRKQSSLWRNALRKIYEENDYDLDKMQNELSRHGIDRTRVTLVSWLFSTKTVAPQNPSQTIPSILLCAGIDNSKELADNILKHVNAVYRARRKAGHFLVAQLSTASLSGLGDSAYIEINGRKIRYRVLSISAINEPTKFDASLLGVHSIHNGFLEAGK
ncbi:MULTISPECIES: DrmE family protein [Gammaproteobacteria]|uniref:DrmE family protein n=1 Tax=Gammaproteobacteria TaxID=1236 RepID=UPI003A95B08C